MRSQKEHVIDALFPLGLLMVFLASAVLVLLLAADIYQDTTGSSARSHTARTVTAYLSEKIHQNDENGSIYLDELEGCPALVLKTGTGEQTYLTYIYCYDGTLRELMVRQDLEISPDRGRKILELQDFRGELLEDGLFYFQCTDTSGRSAEVFVTAQSAQPVVAGQ